MTATATRVVYDCNVYAQALINLSGPAARCVEKTREPAVSLFISRFILAEIRELHDKIPAKYGITAEQTDELAHEVASFATIITDIPEVYRHPFDPDDSHYVNLALRVNGHLIVSRDRHLLNLMDGTRKEGQEFHGRFPSLRILDPVEFLRELDEQQGQAAKSAPAEPS